MHKLVPLFIGTALASGNREAKFWRQRFQIWNPYWGLSQLIRWCRESYLPDLFKKPVVFSVYPWGWHLLSISEWVSSDSTNLLVDMPDLLGKIQGIPLSKSFPWGWWHRFHKYICMVDKELNWIKLDLFREKFQLNYRRENSTCIFKGRHYRKATVLFLSLPWWSPCMKTVCQLKENAASRRNHTVLQLHILDRWQPCN